MNQTKKSSVNVGNINQMIKDEIYNSKYLKTGIYVFGGVLSLFAIGFILKAVTYATANLKALNVTLKHK